MSSPIWIPSKERIETAHITAFSKLAENKFQLTLGTGPKLHRWSAENPELFWPLVWEYGGLIASRYWDTVLQPSKEMRGTKWFLGARLNFAENLLQQKGKKEAIIFYSESGERKALTYDELYFQVAHIANFLRKAGIRVGDRVAGYLPNTPETIVAMLATASIGAIWSSCSPDFGLQGVSDRFQQIKPKVLFVVDGYTYNGKEHNVSQKSEELVKKLKSLEQVVLVTLLGKNSYSDKKIISYEKLIPPKEAPKLEFEQLPFDHPLYILYSSGTTGAPKCIVHSAGGTLLQHVKELLLHTDISENDTFFYFTTCGWMMWNWQVSALALGCTLLLSEGSPFFPSPTTLFDYADQEKVTVFGTSAKYISALEKSGAKPRETHSLASLRTLLSTGSPLLEKSFEYVYTHLKQDVCLASITGGTDIISLFAGGNPTLPVYPGEIQMLGLGMDVDVFDEDGRSIRNAPGELVCKSPFPSMPLSFWKDSDGSKYHAAYLEKYKNIWTHGDWVELTEHEGLIVHGRSDTVLNPGGVRIGTAEIYSVVERLPEISAAVVVGQRWENDERVILFVKLQSGMELTKELAERIKTRIRDYATPRHVPAKIIVVPEIPQTRSGKISEIAVKNTIHKRPIQNTAALANPDALEYFKNRIELEE